MKIKNLLLALPFMVVMLFAYCTKEQVPETIESSTPEINSANDRFDCDLNVAVLSTTSNNWEAKIFVSNLDGSYSLFKHIGGNNLNGKTKIPTGTTGINFQVSSYKKYFISQIQNNVSFKISSLSGTLNRYLYANTISDKFFAGCDVFIGTLDIKVTNACSNLWEAKIRKRDSNGNFIEVAYIGGSGSQAATKIPTGSSYLYPMEGYADYQILQSDLVAVTDKKLLTTSYQLTLPSGVQNVTMDRLSTTNTCIPGNFNDSFLFSGGFIF
jgi:hypothetical protein